MKGLKGKIGWGWGLLVLILASWAAIGLVLFFVLEIYEWLHP